MHMLVGFMLARLLKSRRKSVGYLPTIKGKFEAAHVLPGRIRFRIPLIETTDTKTLRALRRELKKIKAINAVEMNPLSGSLMIRYDKDALEPYLLCGVLLKLLGLEAALDAPPESVLRREMQLLGNALSRQVNSMTVGLLDLTTAISIVLISLGLQKILIQKDRSLPGGLSLFWWAYVIFKSGNRKND